MARSFNLMSGHLGNGITIWNKNRMKHGNYEVVAHIDRNRKISYRIDNPPEEVVKYAEKIAKGPNPGISSSQPDQKVFAERLIGLIEDGEGPGMNAMGTTPTDGASSKRKLRIKRRPVFKSLKLVENIEDLGIDKNEYEMGLEVEKEHTDTLNLLYDMMKENGEEISREMFVNAGVSLIDIDHNLEFDGYYTALDKMENELAKKEKTND